MVRKQFAKLPGPPLQVRVLLSPSIERCPSGLWGRS